jgi:hypothetical protein
LGVDAEGRIRESLWDRGGAAWAPVTSVVEREGWLYLGSLEASGIGRVRL